MTQRVLLPYIPQSDSSKTATVVATVAGTQDIEDLPLLSRRLAGALGAEIRADLVGDLTPEALHGHVSGPLIYTLRSTAYHGTCNDPPEPRRRRLANAAARGFDLVDLESDRDLVPQVLSRIPVHKRLVSWSGRAGDETALRAQLDRMTAVPAAMYRLMVHTDSFGSALLPLRLLTKLRRDDVTAYGLGPAAAFGRVLAPWFGSPIVFGSAQGPTTRELLADYPFPQLPHLDALYGIVFRSLRTSQFLRRVNAALAELQLPFLFLPFVVSDESELREEFLPAIKSDTLSLPVRGLTVAAPYKPQALAASDVADVSALAIDAANLMLRHGQRWLGATTDGAAILSALHDRHRVTGSSAAVVGCGAAGRSAAYSLARAGAHVTLVNRDPQRGRSAAALLELPLVGLADFRPDRYELIVHATPAAETPIFDLGRVGPGCVVADFVCAAEPTALVSAAHDRGLATIDGHEVLTRELGHQFRMMTGRPMPD
jgi:3-dehydroquinate dehydratase/shikimate dehydrogenase